MINSLAEEAVKERPFSKILETAIRFLLLSNLLEHEKLLGFKKSSPRFPQMS
jgi:hypothetical protein